MASTARSYLAIGGGLLALLVAVGGYVTWQRNADNAVSALLADAMVVYEAPVQAPLTPPEPSAAASPAHHADAGHVSDREGQARSGAAEVPGRRRGQPRQHARPAGAAQRRVGPGRARPLRRSPRALRPTGQRHRPRRARGGDGQGAGADSRRAVRSGDRESQDAEHADHRRPAGRRRADGAGRAPIARRARSTTRARRSTRSSRSTPIRCLRPKRAPSSTSSRARAGLRAARAWRSRPPSIRPRRPDFDTTPPVTRRPRASTRPAGAAPRAASSGRCRRRAAGRAAASSAPAPGTARAAAAARPACR